MIGRSEELGRLRDALARARAGVPTAILVGGEAGIGKTRLVDEFLEACERNQAKSLASVPASVPEGVRVLRGGCVPLTDGLLPYAPVVEMLRALEPGPSTDALLDRADGALLLGFLPDRAAGPADAAGVVAPAPDDADQYRVLTAVARLLKRLAIETTLVVVLEDLHWADPSTRALLAYVVHGLRSAHHRLLLIGTFRSDELSSRHPLRSLLAELDRADVVR